MRVKLDKYGAHQLNGDNLYKFETDHILFNLINYAFIQKEYIQRGNKQGIQNVRFEDIKNTLLHLDVKVFIKNEYGQQK